MPDLTEQVGEALWPLMERVASAHERKDLALPPTDPDTWKQFMAQVEEGSSKFFAQLEVFERVARALEAERQATWAAAARAYQEGQDPAVYYPRNFDAAIAKLREAPGGWPYPWREAPDGR